MTTSHVGVGAPPVEAVEHLLQKLVYSRYAQCDLGVAICYHQAPDCAEGVLWLLRRGGLCVTSITPTTLLDLTVSTTPIAAEYVEAGIVSCRESWGWEPNLDATRLVSPGTIDWFMTLAEEYVRSIGVPV